MVENVSVSATKTVMKCLLKSTKKYRILRIEFVGNAVSFLQFQRQKAEIV